MCICVIICINQRFNGMGMAVKSVLDEDEGGEVELKRLNPEEFLEHAKGLIQFEWQGHRLAGVEKEKAKGEPGKPQVSSLAKLAIDGLYDAKEGSSKEEVSKGKLMTLLPKET